MFRKIASNRKPGTTLISEIRKEFGVYFQLVGNKVTRVTQGYPRLCFSFMLVTMLVSGIMTFTVMRHRERVSLPVIYGSSTPPRSGLRQMINNANALKSLWDLQSQIDGLLHKSKLNATDSLTITRALAAMESIRVQIKRDHSPLIQKSSKPLSP